MPPKFQEMLKEQRQNPETSRAGLKWEASEDKILMEKVASDTPIEEIAKIIQRTEGSIKTRLITYAISKIDNENVSLEDAAELVRVSSEDILEYQRKKKIRDEKRLTKIFTTNNKQTRQGQQSNTNQRYNSQQHNSHVTMNDLHSLLLDIKSELTKLTG